MLNLPRKQIPPPANWQDFEELCCDLWKLIWKDPNTQRNGRSGQPQSGVDVCGRPQRGRKWAGVQCKGKAIYKRTSITKTELITEVEKAKSFKPALSEFIFASTGPKDAKVEELARTLTAQHRKQRLFSVHVKGWDDIVAEIDNNDSVAKRHFPTHYFDILTREDLAESSNAGLRHSVAIKNNTDIILSLFVQLFSNQDGSRAYFEELATQHPEFVKLVEGRRKTLEKEKRTNVLRSRAMTKPTLSQIIPLSRLTALGIIRHFFLPINAATLKRLLPHRPWESDIRYLRKAGLLETRGEFVSVSKEVAKRVFDSNYDGKKFSEIWIEALEPLKNFPDLAICLSLNYLEVGLLEKAVRTATDAGEYVESEWLNGLFCTLLAQYNTSKVHRKLPLDDRVHLLNAYALCLTYKSQHREAIAVFNKLRTLCMRDKHNWGLGQAYINGGVAYEVSGDKKSAARWFRLAIAHARKVRDRHLLGRALHDLAMTIGADSPTDVIPLLQESKRLKIATGDHIGMAGAHTGIGMLHVWQGDPAKATRHFRRAASVAHKYHDYRNEASALLSTGSAYYDHGDDRSARSHYQQCRSIAQREGLSSILANALLGLGMVAERNKQHKRAEALFKQAHDSFSDLGNWEQATMCLHAVGVCALRTCRARLARKIFRDAYQLAVTHHNDEWQFRCEFDIAHSYIEATSSSAKAIAQLNSGISNQLCHRNFKLAGRLGHQHARLLIHYGKDSVSIENTFSKALHNLRNDPDESINVLIDLHGWRWESGNYKDALAALAALADFATQSGNDEWLCRALDQHGACLQQLERFDLAKPHQLRALRIARKLKNAVLLTNCLNNVGELFRKTNHLDKATSYFKELKELAKRDSNTDTLLLATHNLALLFQQQSRLKSAQNLLEQCRKTAFKTKNWYEYVRALHGLANIAYDQSKPRVAIKGYEAAIRAIEKYNVPEQRAIICLNAARVLRGQGTPQKALDYLLSLAASEIDGTEAHLFSQEKAELLELLNRGKDARRQWTIARDHAMMLGDEVAIVNVSAGLADNYENAKEYEQAISAILFGMAHTSVPEHLALLYNRQLRYLAKAGKNKPFNDALRQATKFMKEHGFVENLIDAYVMLGDMQWNSPGFRKQAAECYTFALFEASCKVPLVADVVRHFVEKLTDIPLTMRCSQIDEIETHIFMWLGEKDSKTRTSKVKWVAGWPFRVARKITEAHTAGKHLSRVAIGDLFANEWEIRQKQSVKPTSDARMSRRRISAKTRGMK